MTLTEGGDDGTMAGASPRTVQPRRRPIVKAIDLGSTAVLRFGALTLVADPFGDLHPDSRGLGLYHGDTRVLSTLAFLVDDRRPTLLEADAGGYDRGVVQMTNPELRNDPTRSPAAATLANQSLGIRRERRLDTGGLHERITVVNFTILRQDVTAALLVDVDGADIFEVRGYPREARGTLQPIQVRTNRVTFRYRGLDGVELRTMLSFDPPPDRIEASAPEQEGSVRASWRLALEPGEGVTLAWTVDASWHALSRRRGRGDRGQAATVGTHQGTVAGLASGSAPGSVERLEARRDGIGREAAAPTRFESDDELVNLILARGLADVRLLETGGPTPGESFIAAGVPWFATLFGRDSLLTALFMLPVLPDLAGPALEVLARRQGRERDDWRDEEPGKILHELRTGEMARTGELPFTPYYGSVDATPLWLLLLAETHAWTGDDGLVDRLWPHALAAMGWLERAMAPDGFVRYESRSQRGLRNQGWKDSHDSIRDRDGRVATLPIALLEVQCYTVAAFRAIASQAARRGEPELVEHAAGVSAELADRIEVAFWMPELDRYAMAIGGDGRPADALASNVGHALWAGSLDPVRAAAAARDLASPRMSTGWGLRTFGAAQPGYNPLGYHLGTVWPHDTAIAIAGLRRHGFAREAGELASGLFDAARHFPLFRFPELFCGFPRTETRVPVAYPVACAPHAWAAASPFLVLRALLGLEADASNRELRIVRPMLPRPLRKLVVSGLRVGDAEVDLLFQSWRGTTGAEVLRRSGDLAVVVRL